MKNVAIASFVAALVKLLSACNPSLAPEDIYSNLRKMRENLTAEELAAALETVEECYHFPGSPSNDYKAYCLREAKTFLGIEDF